MVTTFFIGNGFDVKNALKTQYCEFLDCYTEAHQNDSITIRRFKDTISNDRTNEGYRYWSDLESQLGRYDPGSEAAFIECYDDIEQALVDYLTKQDEVKYLESTNEGKNKRDLPKGFKFFLTHFWAGASNNERVQQQIKDKQQGETCIFNFINLNYTQLAADCVDAMRTDINDGPENWKDALSHIKIGEYIQPHGSLPTIIFGVADPEQIANPLFRESKEITRRIIKKQRIDYLGKTWFDDGVRLIDNSDIICLFGISLGETDLHWWREVSKWINKNPNNKLLIYRRANDEEKRQKVQESTKYILKKSGLSNDQYDNQVIISFDEKQFAEIFVHAYSSSTVKLKSFAFAYAEVVHAGEENDEDND